MNIKSKEIKEIIASNLKSKLLLYGFNYKKNSNEFIKVENNFTYIFNIEQVGWTGGFSLDVWLYIREKEIQNIFETIVGNRYHRMTIGQRLGRILNSPDGRKIINGDLSIWLKEDKDVESAIKLLESYYDDIAIKYFNRFQTLEDIDDIINKPPFDYCPAYVGGFFDARCMKGLIVAKLVSNPNYKKLVSIYNEKILETENQESIENYYKVRDFLNQN